MFALLLSGVKVTPRLYRAVSGITATHHEGKWERMIASHRQHTILSFTGRTFCWSWWLLAMDRQWCSCARPWGEWYQGWYGHPPSVLSLALCPRGVCMTKHRSVALLHAKVMPPVQSSPHWFSLCSSIKTGSYSALDLDGFPLFSL